MHKKAVKPEWVPENDTEGFTTQVIEGINSDNIEKKKNTVRKSVFSIDEYVAGIRAGNRTILSKAITLVESNSPKHKNQTQELLKQIIPFSGNSIRIGISGPPGAGKSTFIEALGSFLADNNQKVAVLAIDPSSTLSKGSILGDKTRMEILSGKDNAFIRPSPSGGTLGGVARKTRETILLCEAAGFNIILIETIGVGQSEITVRSMVDLFLLLLLPGSGDELQGIKKGVVEISDLMVVNKADGDMKDRAELTKSSYISALRLLTSPTPGWQPKVLTCSSVNNVGIDRVWSVINEFFIEVKNSGFFEQRRKSQTLEWVYNLVDDFIYYKFYNQQNFLKNKSEIENLVLTNNITPSQAVEQILKLMNV